MSALNEQQFGNTGDRYSGMRNQKLATALRADDAAEDRGMHPNDRKTCYSCKSWASPTHEHGIFTGKRISW